MKMKKTVWMAALATLASAMKTKHNTGANIMKIRNLILGGLLAATMASQGAVNMQVQTTTDRAGTDLQADWDLVDGDRALAQISGVVDGVTITVDAMYGRANPDGGNYPLVDHSDGDLDNLLSGGRASNSAGTPIVLTLAGLADGDYSITTYLHTSYVGTDGFDFDVLVTDFGRTGVKVHDDLAISYGSSVTTAALAAPVTTFTVSGGNDVVLTFSIDADFGSGDQLYLNGFELSTVSVNQVQTTTDLALRVPHNYAAAHS